MKELYASGGHNNQIVIYNIENNRLIEADSVVLGKKWPNKIAPAGIAVDGNYSIWYVVQESNKLYIVDLNTKQTILEYQLGGEAYAHRSCHRTENNCTSVAGVAIRSIFDTKTRNVTAEVAVGDNPNELLLTKKGKLLYVANSNDNTVSVIDVATQRVIEVLNATPLSRYPNGSTTNGLALSEDEKTLYVANADNNCLAVYDVSKPVQSKSKGFIPTGWYQPM